jgi:hypothetical protein
VKSFLISRGCLASALAAVLLNWCFGVRAQGIPEPSLIMYGVIRNTNSGANITWNFGTITWTIRPSGGQSVVLTASLTNINDQFCYILEVPCENTIGGFTVSSNTLPLSSASVSFDRSQVVINGTNRVAFVTPSQTNIMLSALDRGRIEQVDLNVSIPLTDIDGNGLPDDWERFHFGHIGVDPNDDPDHDGKSNFAEYKAGTDPNDPNSFFRIIKISALPGIGSLLQWSSTPDKFYGLQRSTSLLGGFRDIAVGLPSTPTMNSYTDSVASVGGPYFYRVRLDRVFINSLDLDGNGLPDDWERLYFGAIGVDPGADPDHDGMTNLQEYQAGTNPLDNNSHLSFVNVKNVDSSQNGQPGPRVSMPLVEWSSIYGKHYSVLRSADPRAGYAVLQTDIVATPPLNSFTDTNAVGAGPFFYRVRLDF